jgi:lipopolysaccharide/colanic/teichoic acid biosynthesis glycosyltransferase
MYRGADEILRAHLDNDAAARAEWDNSQKLRSDPRVTAVGRLLRRTSLDELPQTWNVLVGDMSIVGPRPIIDEEVRRYGAALRHYATVKPGITGLWQVSGRNDVSYQQRVQLDQFYIRHWSPWLDLHILAKTVVVLIKRRGAY